jgi:glyoxylase-like metal-dependent hydrolase (beta-lactamase superfamily II)
MEQIAANVFIERSDRGVVWGLIRLEEGIVFIDAPCDLQDLPSGIENGSPLVDGDNQYLVLLDAHIDRTFKAHLLKTNIIMHNTAVEILSNRTASIKRQDLGYDGHLDDYENQETIRWLIPDITFSDQMSIHLGESPIVISHHCGAHLAGSWVRYEPEKIIFVGDSVLTNKMPDIAWSDLECWLADLDILASAEFGDYLIVSGREGVVSQEAVAEAKKCLSEIKLLVDETLRADLAIEEMLKGLSRKISEISLVRDLKIDNLDGLVWSFEKYIKRHMHQIK